MTAAAGCGVLGLAIGALLPIVIERVPERRSLGGPYPEIGAGLRTWSGRLLVLGTGLLFAAIGWRFAESSALPVFLLLGAALVALSVIDLEHFLLPNRIIYPVTATSIVLLAAAAAVADSDGDAFLRSLACAAGAFAVFAVLHLVSPRAMGFGDVRLALLLGLDLGWLGAGEVVLGLLLGFVYGAVIGLLLIATGVKSRRDHIPFGPFLAAGALTALLVGEAILDWYSG
jgi:leader peptidase (prepilin peptidase)/N-methyltransferase